MGGRTIHDPMLGRLTWDDQLAWWEGAAEIAPGHSVDLAVASDGPEELPPALETARRVVAWVREHEARCRWHAAEQLLDVYNASWCRGEMLDARAFMDRMALESVNVSPGGPHELFYNDGDLFWGHTVVVEVDDDGAFGSAYLAG
jgi:hypothetical protein